MAGVSQRFACDDPAQRHAGVRAAAAAIRRGALVVFPADAAYVLAADAFSPAATTALRAAKGRPEHSPLPVLVGNPGVVDALALGLTDSGRTLIEAFWPGPVTLLVQPQPSLAWDVDPSGSAVGLRMPLHPVALELLTTTGPLAATGANYAAMAVPLTCDDAIAQLGDAVAIYLDAGTADPSRASAVVDVTQEPARLARAGSVDLDRLRLACPDIDTSLE